MPDWLVITADRQGAGRGVRGYALAWFLRTSFGRRAVTLRTPQQVRDAAPPTAETLFIGLPSSLAPDELRRLFDAVRPRHIVAFDYYDRHDLAWTAEQEVAFRERTDRYFKPWFEPAWRYNLRMGLLPLRSNPRLFAAVAQDRVLAYLGPRRAPDVDVAFLGRPNRTRVIADGRVVKLDQRINWLREIRRDAPDLKLWGGVTHDPDPNDYDEGEPVADVTDLRFPKNEVSFFTYWRALRRARVLLSPGGNAPWTYRHYECLYAGGVVVSIDFRQRDMLVPLPRENMVHVPDGAPVLPAVRAALAWSRERRTLAEENFAHLERYLHFGSYAKSRAALIERFTAQLE